MRNKNEEKILIQCQGTYDTHAYGPVTLAIYSDLLRPVQSIAQRLVPV